jgi:N-acetylmuramoyl-L-alanine amidase
VSKRVFIGVGHGGSDPGACANGLRESDVALAVALACRDELVRHGVTVGISRTKDENDRLAEEIKECNAFNPDVAIEVHFNAGGGKGAEIFTQNNSAKSTALANNIMRRIIVNLGQTSRGLKYNSKLGWTREVKAPCVLIEGAFLDSDDYLRVSTAEKQKAFGQAYAHGVLDYLGIPIQAETEGKKVTYEEFCAFMTRYKQEIEKLPCDDWAGEAWNKAEEQGVFDGSAPQSPLTREQAALVLQRIGFIGK